MRNIMTFTVYFDRGSNSQIFLLTPLFLLCETNKKVSLRKPLSFFAFLRFSVTVKKVSSALFFRRSDFFQNSCFFSPFRALFLVSGLFFRIVWLRTTRGAGDYARAVLMGDFASGRLRSTRTVATTKSFGMPFPPYRPFR